MPDEIYEKYCRHGPRKDETKTWATEEVGRRFRNGRRLAGRSQRWVASRANVSQSEVSRFERGMTPHMSAHKVVAIGLALGPRFPFGYCPHDHDCVYARPSAEKQYWQRLDAQAETAELAPPGSSLADLLADGGGITDETRDISRFAVDIGIDFDVLRIPEGGLKRNQAPASPKPPAASTMTRPASDPKVSASTSSRRRGPRSHRSPGP